VRLRESWCRAIEDSGFQYNFVSYGQMEQGELIRGGYRVLVLPRSTALSTAEVRAIRDFVEQGGTVIADGEPGRFDEHGRKLAAPQLADLFGGSHPTPISEKSFGRGKAIFLSASVLDYHRERVVEKGEPTRRLVASLLTGAGLHPAFTVTDDRGNSIAGVETHTFRNGAVTLVGLLNNPDLRVDELGPPDFRSNEHFAHKRSLRLSLPESLSVYDVRNGKTLGKRKEIGLELDAYEPVIYAVTAEPLPELSMSAPARIARGETVRVSIRFAGSSAAAVPVVHVDVTDPAGQAVSYYSGNLRVPQGQAAWQIPIAWNDAAGTWHVRVRDVLTGSVQSAAFEVF
jgi:hypothetical protein